VSKSTEHVLLVPGESGWEIWTGHGEGGYALHRATATTHAAELTEIPAGDLTMLFPVRSLTAVPMRVSSDDESLFPDLAALHAERLGLRPDPMAGQLTDVFVIAREPENSSLLAVFLRTPGEGDLPPRGPKGFDLSSRAFPVDGDVLTVWKEFDRWVFALFQKGTLVFSQATAVDSAQPDDSLAREIRLSLIQLSIQGLEVEPSRITVWSSDADTDTKALANAFRTRVEVHPRPVPVPPLPLSKLLPADVRAARRAALRRRNITLAISAAALVYLSLIGWFAFGLWKSMQETKNLLAQAEAAAPEGAAYAEHIAKWDELAPAIDLANSPVDILHRVATCIPPNSGLRLKTAEISGTEIRLIGEAPQLQAVNTFSLNLTKNNELAKFEWQTPEPNQSTRGWEFVFSAEVPNLQP
jgi:hypothetical protein